MSTPGPSIYHELGFKPRAERASGAALYNLARTFTLVNRVFQRCYARFDLTPAKLNVLMVVKHVGGAEGLPQQAIAARLIVSDSNVTGLLDRLERDGLLTRSATTHDRRVKLIRITPKGSAVLDRAWPAHLQQVERVMRRLTPAEQKRLAALLTKVRRALETGPADG